MASIIDGKAVAKEVQKQIKEEVDGLERRWGMAPGLGVILVGDDPGSHIYVKNKEKACKEVGIKSFEHLLPATISGRKEFWKRFLRIRMLTGFIPSARECWCLAAMASGRARRWAS